MPQGAWADNLRQQTGEKAVVRPLRGSHLVLPCWRLPIAQACCFMHPDDGRPVFVFPWEGATIIGTTDLDHEADLDEEPVISPQEVDYLLQAVNTEFPGGHIQRRDVISTWSGVRPVISSGRKIAPSKENREHAIWDNQRLITVCGGKLTTFRLIARDALKQALEYFPGLSLPEQGTEPAEDEQVMPDDPRFLALETGQQQRLRGRLGRQLNNAPAGAGDTDFRRVDGTDFLWLELRWAVAGEQVQHLDDLLLRRTRVGNLLPGGGNNILPALEEMVCTALNWDKRHWDDESERYLTLWRKAYSLPEALE